MKNQPPKSCKYPKPLSNYALGKTSSCFVCPILSLGIFIFMPKRTLKFASFVFPSFTMKTTQLSEHVLRFLDSSYSHCTLAQIHPINQQTWPSNFLFKKRLTKNSVGGKCKLWPFRDTKHKRWVKSYSYNLQGGYGGKRFVLYKKIKRFHKYGIYRLGIRYILWRVPTLLGPKSIWTTDWWAVSMPGVVCSFIASWQMKWIN